MNVYGTPAGPPQPGLERAIRRRMLTPSVRLSGPQAHALVEQFRRTASTRRWTLYARVVMANHVHVVVGVPGDPDPSWVMRDLKSYGSRSLNERWGGGTPRRWWTRSGSQRLLRGEPHVVAAVRYVRGQYRPLALWIAADRDW